MKIIAISDIHNNLEFLPAAKADIETADLLLIAGDITNFGGMEQTKQIISELKRLNSNIFAVSGNCDDPEVGVYLDEEGVGINCNCKEYDSVNFVGVSGAVESGQSRFGHSLEEHFQNTLEEIERQTALLVPLVLVTHHPARGTAVEARGGGSEAIYEFIKRRQPILCVSGHIHESYGQDTIDGSVLVNPGAFKDGSYAEIEIIDGEVEKTLIRKL